MTLGEGGNFSCEWGQVNIIQFHKGVKPGTRDEVVIYEAVYNPEGNSYLGIYGWFQNPLVEYYIIESWGTVKPPPEGISKGTIETDNGTYDIYQNSRTGASIEGNKTFQQYWSVRTQKRTSGTITCKNHFDAWEDAGMTIGTFYELSFNVEAYQSAGGQADVQLIITTDTNGIHSGTVYNKSGTVLAPLNSSAPLQLYNALGQKIGLSGSEYFAGQRSIIFKASKRASGVYFTVKTGKR
jgi:hypothetical protein